MYTSVEKAPTYAPTFPSVKGARKKIAGATHKLLTAVLGREFMELSTGGKVYGSYFVVSFALLLSVFSEKWPWLSLVFAANMANAARLYNKAEKKASANERYL